MMAAERRRQGLEPKSRSTGCNHETACPDSRRLCELFGEQLRRIVPSAERTPRAHACSHSLVVDATNSVVWIYHTKKKGTVTVFMRRDAGEPLDVGSSSLPFKTRALSYRGAFHEFGHHVTIASSPEMEELFSVMCGNGFFGTTSGDGAEDSTERIYPDELRASEVFLEGMGEKVLVNRYERNPAARRACLEHFGCVCAVCGMSFGEVYGAAVLGVMHVHHLNPKCDAHGLVEVNPLVDLRPVCPNCHTVIHSRHPCYSDEEVRRMLKTAES